MMGKEQGQSAPAAIEAESGQSSFEDFFENGAIALHLVGGDGTILRANKAELELLGYPAEEYIGRPVADFHADRHVIDDILVRLARGETLQKYPARLRARDGSIKHVEITSSVQFRNGRFLNTRCFTIDVTELERARESEARRMAELAALYKFTGELHRAESLSAVCDAALDAIISALGCNRASILLFDSSGVMRFVAWRGLSDGYRSEVDGHSPWGPDVKNPEPICVADIDLADIPESLKRVIRKEGIRALAFIPLVVDGRLIGKFMTYYETPHVFSDEEVDIALATARQVAFGVDRKRAETARRRAEEELQRNEERFRLATQTGKIGVWDWDIAANRVTWSDSLYAIHGVKKEGFTVTAESFLALVHPEDRDRIAKVLNATLHENTPYELEFRAVKPDGHVIWLFTNAAVLREDDKPVRMLGATMEITERKQAEDRFRLAVEAAPSGMVLADSEGRIVLVNAHAETLFGYSRDELFGQPIEILVPERFRGTHPGFREHYGHKPDARPMGAGRDLFALRKDGREVPVEIGLSPIETSKGLMVLGAVVDISERKRAEAQRELLLAELNHRVKNTLAVVQGIAHQTFKDTDASPEARSAFEGRLVALGAAHSLLTKVNWETASLERLTTDALTAVSAESGSRVSLGGPRVLLEPKQALAMSMALHELCTNALKHGALSNDTGWVALEWATSDGPDPRLKLVWRECGGPCVTPPKRRGFGSRMVEQALAQDLNGNVHMDFRPEGLICTIEAPLPPQDGRVA